MVGFVVCEERDGQRRQLASELRAWLAEVLMAWVPVRALADVGALVEVFDEFEPELVVLGAGRDPARTLDGLRALRARAPHAAVLWAGTDISWCAEALAAGARGVLPVPESDVPDLDQAVGRAATPSVSSTTMVDGDVGARAAGPVLSDRELEVLIAMSYGISAGRIAQRLALQVSTVKSHTRGLFGKLGVHTRADAVAAGFRLGLLT